MKTIPKHTKGRIRMEPSNRVARWLTTKLFGYMARLYASTHNQNRDNDGQEWLEQSHSLPQANQVRSNRMNVEDLRIVLEAKSVLIDAAIEQLRENVQALKLAQNIIEERDKQIAELVEDQEWTVHWRKKSHTMLHENAELKRQLESARSVAVRLEQEIAQCMNTDWHSDSWR